MERISDKQIAEALINVTDERVYKGDGISVSTIDIYPALELQLAADLAEHERVVKLLIKAVSIIESWHNMSAVGVLSDEKMKAIWDIYYKNSPEMKPIREYLSKYLKEAQ